MTNFSRRDHSLLTHTLKQFAFDESPQFQYGATDTMSVERDFGVRDRWPVSVPGQLDVDETKFTIGFRATRIVIGGGWKPGYVFECKALGDKLVHPCQLQLPPEDWYALYTTYEDQADGDDADILTPHQLEPSDVAPVLVDEDVVCEQYRRQDYLFDTTFGGIKFSDETGYVVGGRTYGMKETHPYEGGHYLHTMPVIYEGGDSTRDPIAAEIRFDEVAAGLYEELEANGNLMPHDTKLKEMLWIVGCLRTRRLPIG